jgi:toxin YoeB
MNNRRSILATALPAPGTGIASCGFSIKYANQLRTSVGFSTTGRKHEISALIDDILEHPYTGLGKPEALKYELSGSWSRRITQTDRLVYSVDIENNRIEIETLRGHY